MSKEAVKLSRRYVAHQGWAAAEGKKPSGEGLGNGGRETIGALPGSASFRGNLSLAGQDAYVQVEGGNFTQRGSGGNLAARTTFSQEAVSAVVGRVEQRAHEIDAGQSGIGLQAQALLSMMEDFNANKSKETIAKNLSTFLQDAANNEAVARRQGEEEDKWQPGERSQFFILDPEGQKSGIFSEEIDDLLDKDGNKRMIKEMLRAVFPTSSLLNLEKAVDKLVDVYEAEAGNLEKKPNGGPHVVKMVAALYKEVAGVEKWLAHVNKTCMQIQNNNGITAKVAFDLVIKESKRALLVKAGNTRAVAQDSWNPDAAKLMRLLAAGEGADGGGARGRGKGE